jgi:hypothetical protein
MDDLTGVLAILFIFGTPFLVSIVIGGLWWLNVQGKRAERARARELYESLMREKLDVIKTAIAMEFSGQDLRALDARLEQLIGAENMRLLLDADLPGTPKGPGDVPDRDLPVATDKEQRRWSERAED